MWLAALQADELVQRVRAAKQYGKQVRHHAGNKVSIHAVIRVNCTHALCVSIPMAVRPQRRRTQA